MFERISKYLKDKRNKNIYSVEEKIFVHQAFIDGETVLLPVGVMLTSDEYNDLQSKNKRIARKALDKLFIRELYAMRGYIHEQEKDLERYNNRLKSLIDKVNALKIKVDALEDKNKT